MASHALSALFDGAQAPHVSIFSGSRDCLLCGESFVRWDWRQKYCGKECQRSAARERSRIANNSGVVGSIKKCETCGTSVKMTGSRQKFCEHCAHESRLASKRRTDAALRAASGVVTIGSIVSCKGCGTDFVKSATVQDYCNLDCRAASMRKGRPPIPCVDCGSVFERRANVSKRCDACADTRAAARNRETRLRNADSIQESRLKWAENPSNRDKIVNGRRERKKNKRATDPAYVINCRMSSAINGCLKGNKSGRPWESLVGYSLTDLCAHLERQFLPGMSWENRSKWHIDHIVPLSSFMFSDPEDESFKAAWALTNLRPLWWRDNLSKNAKRIYLI